MVDRPAVAVVERYIRALLDGGVDVGLCVLFGSTAIGRADHDSDIDVLVVAHQFDGATNRADVGRLWRIAADVDSRIEPVACGCEQWASDITNPLLGEVRRTGHVVPASAAPVV